jgi:transcriptional regulator GlxA family with amidase domain
MAQWLRDVFNPQHHQIITVCSGVFLLGAAGLLAGVKCTTHHRLLDDLRHQFPNASVEDNRVFVDSGAILTSAGVTAGFDVILYWLGQRFGADLALSVARHMNVYFRRTGNDSALSPWLIARNHMHPAVHRVQDAIARSPEQTHDLHALANIACVSSRHLTRVFKQYTGMTVHGYQVALRHALFDQWRAQGLSQEKAAIAAGFSSANAWRRSRSGSAN